MEKETDVEDNEQDETQEEMFGPGVNNLVGSALDQKPLEFQQTFNDLLQQRISDAVQARKLELASGLASQYDAGEEESPDDDDETEYDEEQPDHGETDDSEETESE